MLSKQAAAAAAAAKKKRRRRRRYLTTRMDRVKDHLDLSQVPWVEMGAAEANKTSSASVGNF